MHWYVDIDQRYDFHFFRGGGDMILNEKGNTNCQNFRRD